MAERKSIYHGLTSDGHGPDERGLGALASPEDPRDYAIADHPGYAAALATAFPSAWLEPNTPPVPVGSATDSERPNLRAARPRGTRSPPPPRSRRQCSSGSTSWG